MSITWKEFKDFVESQGVLDTDEIEYIETPIFPTIDEHGSTDLYLHLNTKGRTFSIC